MEENIKIDYVLSYIDYNQKEVQELYTKVSNKEFNYKYNLNYIDIELVIRLIFKNMAFINNLYIVCKDIQVLPDNVENLIKEFDGRIIRINESQIIPDNYITFSSACIEMFIWKIPGLSEYFIYGCDDMIPIRQLNQHMFFENDKTINSVPFHQIYNFFCLYYLHCLNNTNLIFNRCKNNDNYNLVYESTHTFRSLRKSLCEECYNKYKSFIDSSITPIRFYNNFNMDLYVLYAIKNNLNIDELRYVYQFDNLSTNINIINYLNLTIQLKNYKNLPDVICLNDTIEDEKTYLEAIEKTKELLSKLYYINI